MQEFIGTKQVTARPMTRLEYNEYRGWQLPTDEDGNDNGYLVEYADSDSNHKDHAGYISWSPIEQFEYSYESVSGTGMTFGHAVELLKQGYKVARKGWNGKAMFLFLVPGSKFKVNRAPLLGIYPEGTEINYHAHIDMRTADGTIVPWLASQSDVLSKDWTVVE